MNIDLIPNGAIKRVHVSQNDVGRTLTFELFNNSTSYSVPSGATVKIQGTKPSGFGFSETCTVSGNTATIDTTEAMTDESGNIQTELSISYDDVVIGTSNFVLAVEKNPHPDTTTDGSMETIIPELTLLVNEVKGYAEEIEGTYHAYGSPWVASTVAQMTDTDKIYVYTGSESGYTNGNWYYYNGTAWVSGGVYNSVAVQTDTTLSVSGMPADAKITGDARDNVNRIASTYYDFASREISASPEGWRLNESDGLCSADSSYKLVKYTVTEGELIRVVCDDRFQFQNNASVPANGASNRIGVTYGAYDGVLIVPSGATYLILSTKIADGTAECYSAEVAIDKTLSIADMPADAEVVGYIKKSSMVDTSTLKFALGTINTDYGRFESSTTRIVSHIPFTLKKGEYIFLDSNNYNFFLSRYASDGSYLGSTGTWDNIYVATQDIKTYIGIRKSSNATITSNEIDGILEHLAIYGELETSETDEDELFLGSLVSGTVKAWDEGITTDTTKLVTQNVLSFPYERVKLTVHLAPRFRAKIYFSDNADNLTTNTSDWLKDGDTFTSYFGTTYFRVVVAIWSKYNNYSMSGNMTTDMVDEIGLSFTYQNQISPTIDTAQLNNVNTSLRYFETASTESVNNRGTRQAIIHCSDVHGAWEGLKKFVYIANHSPSLLGVITGDIVPYSNYNGFENIENILTEGEVPMLVLAGNHEYNGDSTFTENDLYNNMFEALNEKWGYSQAKTYYYRDKNNIRVICLNQYEGSRNQYGQQLYTQTQLQWLIDTLESTPAGYIVYIAYHTPEEDITGCKDESYSMFWQNSQSTYSSNKTLVGTPIKDIVDAFISRASFSKTYTQGQSTMSVSGDFTNIASNTYFIAHLTGHRHMDSICYLPNTTNKQLMLNIDCLLPWYGTEYVYQANSSELSRDYYGKGDMIANVYITNKTTKMVTVVRVGADTTNDFRVRSVMTIPFE